MPRRRIRQQLEDLLILIRICRETKAFRNFKSFEFAIEEVITVSRQNEEWIKSVGGAKGA
jgi:hypothetical protein